MSSTRRHFIQSSLAASAAAAMPAPAGKDNISLANWSIVQSFRLGKWKLLDLPRIMREELQIYGLEYVNTFFENPILQYLQRLKRNIQDNGITSVLIMVDEEGNTAAVDKAERIEAAVAHRKWIDTAHYLGCHAIRCNLRGGPKEWQKDKDIAKRGAEAFHDMLEYSKGSGVNIILENHGGASSDPDVLTELMGLVKNPRFGMLVDTGNWNPGVDRYEAVKRMMPYAKGVSAKGTWGDDLRPDFDLAKLLQVCVDSGYRGWYGIESGLRRAQGSPALSADETWQGEVKMILGSKAVIERVVLKKG